MGEDSIMVKQGEMGTELSYSILLKEKKQVLSTIYH